MNKFDAYSAELDSGTIKPMDTSTQTAMDEYNKNLSSGADNKFTGYLKELNGLTPERKARMEAKLAAHGATGKYASGAGGQITEFPGLIGDIAQNPGEYGQSMFRSSSAYLSDLANTATLGGYKKARDYALKKLDPQGLQDITQAESEYHKPISGNPLFRGVQIGANALNSVAGYGLGAPGLLGAAAGAAAKGAGVVGQGLAGAASGGLAAGGQAAIEGERPMEALKQAGIGAAAGGVVGGALGGIGKAMAGAPARAAESEMAGLTEGVGQRTKITKFLPKKEIITRELAQEPALRRAIRDAPTDAFPAVQKKLEQVAENDLEPIYSGLARSGQDMVDVNLPVNNLLVLKSQFTRHAERAQRAVIDQLIEGLKEDAIANNHRIPMQMLREEATAYQAQGFANLQQFGQVALSKEAKQGIGGALRESIADHIKTVPGGDSLVQMFDDANKRVSAWYAIKDLMEEKVKRVSTDSPTLMSVAKGVKGFVNNPLASMLPLAGPFGEAIDQGAIAPLMSSMSRPAQAARGIGRAAQQIAPVAAGPQYGEMQRAIDEKERLRQQAAANLYQENP